MSIAIFKRWVRPAFITLLALVALTQVAGWVVEKRMQRALGEDGSLESLRFSLNGTMIIKGLRLGVPEGWPAAETLQVERAVVWLDWWSLLHGDYRLKNIRAHGAYVSALRDPAHGIAIVPSLFKTSLHQRVKREWDHPLHVVEAEIEDGTLEFFDNNVSQPPLKLRVEDLHVRVEDLQIPALDTRSPVELGGTIKGPENDGEFGVKGWVQMDTRDSSLEIEVKALDLLAVQPYVLRDSELGVQRGLMDLKLQSRVRANRLDAPGSVRLSQLAFESGEGIKGTFMGVPRAALLKLMEERHGEINLKFHLQGDLDDPEFTINEILPLRLAVGMAEALGVSIKGVVSGVGTLGGKGLEAIGEAAKGIGGLFGIKADDSDKGKK